MLPKFSLLPRLSIFLILLSLISSCSGNSALENRFAPDPELNRTQSPNNSPQPVTNLPAAFPQDIPRYPNARILSVETGLSPSQGKTLWESEDPLNLFKIRYQEEFQRNNWEIIQPFTPDSRESGDRLIVRKANLEAQVYLAQVGASNQFVLEYRLNDGESPPSSPLPLTSVPSSPNRFTDLTDTPAPLNKYIQDLASLGALTAYQGTLDQFKPNNPITRREYARWLFNVHNQLYVNTPERQIRPSSPNSTPLFQDIKTSDPDFSQIQGLAEAGILPSSLTGDTTVSLFRPDAPLTREDLLIWKVPVDLRKALPSATIENVKETWGFQDTSKIDPKALRALYADFQNGDRGNVRRVFGYTTLFNPKKPVTRAEAATALWYFGFQDEGISAQDALTTQNSGNIANPTPLN